MKRIFNSTRLTPLIAGPLLMLSAAAIAQDAPSECVELGALAYENWTKSQAGGSGDLPAGVENQDYIRCKACHGWDRRGTDGGYVRRSRRDTRPNAGAGDGDATSRTIETGTVTAEMILHAGTGRSYAEGTGSWVALDEMHSAANKAAHANGYTLGNQHPDLSMDGPTQDQVDCLVEFLNYQDGDPSVYFSAIDPSQNPVLYTIVETADAAAGETFVNDHCIGCHTEQWLLDYLAQDGKFSEFAHKARWGSPGNMSRSTIGDPTAQDVADMMLYLQETGGTGFALNPGLTGHWYTTDRSGEGFMLHFGNAGDVLTLFASFYTYAPDGTQVWLVAQSTSIDGITANVTVYVTGERSWGETTGHFTEEWGTGSFTFADCENATMSLTPNATYEGEGFTPLSYDINRTDFPITSEVACPSPTPASN